MKKTLILTLLVVLVTANFAVRADEGMWLPSLIEKGLIKKMKNRGLKLSTEDLYSINKASLKDAIVQFGGGCTAELISDKGLLLTNHHCGHSMIQSHSTLEKDYLTNGFVAASAREELPNKGLTVSFLKYMKDVTPQATEGTKASMTNTQRDELVKKNIAKIVDRTISGEGGKGYRASVEPLYYGNQYFLFVYQVYSDVRLVFAPASSIGKFGGDTDNWMWPRHTGDFSIFRIYADHNNEPAEYAASNVPYTPKRSLVISKNGIQEGDYTMVYGFPGRTSEYLHSKAVYHIVNQSNPHRIALRTICLDLMNQAQEVDPEVRIKYSSKNAYIANGWKKWQGETMGLNRLKTIEKKQELERQFDTWAADKPEYQCLTAKLGHLYDSLQPYSFANDYYSEAIFAVEAVEFATRFLTVDTSNFEPIKLKNMAVDFYKNYSRELDMAIAEKLFVEFDKNIPSQFVPQGFTTARLLELLKTDTLLTNQANLMALLNKADVSEVVATLHANPLMRTIAAMYMTRNNEIRPAITSLNSQITELYRPYMRGLMLLQPDKMFFPDANFTLRIAYGQVAGYSPKDAVYYSPISTLEGVAQKDNPEIYDYDVPEKLREVIRTKDYGVYGVNGSVPVAFIATNHTTGGNSGSPVLNAKGQLIGINFDRTWEGTMSDIEFDASVCRNIALDIRYVLFVVDKIGGAGYLLDEMKFAK